VIYPEDLRRFHEAARMVELDGVEAYFSLEHRFGREVAGMLVVLFLRLRFGSAESTAPLSDEAMAKIENILRAAGRMRDPALPDHPLVKVLTPEEAAHGFPGINAGIERANRARRET
jgi:hypothetical protein